MLCTVYSAGDLYILLCVLYCTFGNLLYICTFLRRSHCVVVVVVVVVIVVVVYSGHWERDKKHGRGSRKTVTGVVEEQVFVL